MTHEVTVSLEHPGRDIWVSVHGHEGRELDVSRQRLENESARFEFDEATEIVGIGFWDAPSAGEWFGYEPIAISGAEALTVTCAFDVSIGPEIHVAEEMDLAQYNTAGDVHPVRDLVRLRPGRYTPKLPNPLSQNEPLDVSVEGSILRFRRAPDEVYAKTMETLVRGSHHLSEIYFRSVSGHEVTVIVDFETKVALEGRRDFRLIDIHRLGHRKRL